MTMEHAVRSVYGSMKPLPGAEERMWQAIDEKLKGKGNRVQIKLRPRRSKRPLLLAAAAILALVLVTAAVIRQMPQDLPADELPADQTVEPTPETAEDPVVIPQVRQILLVNARVDGKEILELTEEGRYLARALLPEGYTVDHWEINEEPVDAGNRLYTLEFDSEGVWKVEAVLREELRVKCVNAYLQFLDENGRAVGEMYEEVSFEYDYTVPATGIEHPGGSITVFVSPLLPQGQELDYWLIDGEKVESSRPARCILLQDLDRGVKIEAVLREGDSRIAKGEPIILEGSGEAREQTPIPTLEDDLPCDEAARPGNSPWREIDADLDGVPIDPLAPTEDGHEHMWTLVDRVSGWCTGWDVGVYRCQTCGEEYRLVEPGYHQLICRDRGENHIRICTVCGAEYPLEPHNYVWERYTSTHSQRCRDCGHRGITEEHVYVYVSGWSWVCSVCGASRTAPPPDYNPTDP